MCRTGLPLPVATCRAPREAATTAFRARACLFSNPLALRDNPGSVVLQAHHLAPVLPELAQALVVATIGLPDPLPAGLHSLPRNDAPRHLARRHAALLQLQDRDILMGHHVAHPGRPALEADL